MSGRLLLVDDDQSTCELLEIMLRREGLEVEWRTSGHDAVELVAERDFDVVLTDLGMAALGGAELCERILAIRPERARGGGHRQRQLRRRGRRRSAPAPTTSSPSRSTPSSSRWWSRGPSSTGSSARR